MMNFDPGKLAKGVMQNLEKGEAAGSAKDLLHGVKEAASGNVPEQMLEALRKLISEAKRLLEAAGNKNPALEAAVEKAQKLLESKDPSVAVVTKATAELGALIKEAGTKTAADAAPKAAAERAPASPAKAANPTPRAAVEKAPASPAKAADAAPKAAAPSAPAKTVQFSDVKAGAYYYEAVQWAVQNGIVSGTSETTFSPDQNCTRAQAVCILWRAEGSPAPKSGNNPFTDIAEKAFYYKAALWAAERGIVTGTAFQPDGVLTRGLLATLLYRNAGSPAVSGGADFKDVPANAYYAKPVAWAAQQGIASGTGDHTFSPDAVCTRGQTVTFLYRAKK